MLNYFLKLINCNKRRTTQGGAVAAPVAGKILKEVIEYLEINEDDEATSEKISTVIVPDITYKNLKEAEEILKENNLKIEYETDIENNKKNEYVVKQQIPSAGITINSDNKVKVFLN